MKFVGELFLVNEQQVRSERQVKLLFRKWARGKFASNVARRVRAKIGQKGQVSALPKFAHPLRRFIKVPSIHGLVANGRGHLLKIMSALFLDLVGITHENGLISEENVPKPDADKVKAAAKELATKFPPEEVSLYLATLVSQDPETWEALIDES